FGRLGHGSAGLCVDPPPPPDRGLSDGIRMADPADRRGFVAPGPGGGRTGSTSGDRRGASGLGREPIPPPSGTIAASPGPKPLGEELRRAVSEVQFGLPWQQALERMVVRSEVPSLRALVAALSRSQQLGTVLGSTLRRVAENLRREQRARAEEAARKAPIKMLFALVFLILPAFLLLTVGPV